MTTAAPGHRPGRVPALSFDVPLVEAVIVRRQSRFTMLVDILGEQRSFHCPTTGRIGNLDLVGRPCLVSRSGDTSRKTAGTVEAISLGRREDPGKDWIGINQNAVNRYVEHFLVNGGFTQMVGTGELQRERFLGDSKLDFLVGDTYLEVKTPLQHLQVEVPEWVGTKKVTPFSSTQRLSRHVAGLAAALAEHQRAILLLCFIYDNPGFRIVQRSTNHEQVRATVADSVGRGVEIWQANFRITPESVGLERYFPVELI